MYKGKIPGLSAVVVNATDILWANAYGYSDPENQIKATTETLFTHASISKTVISFVVMQLYDLGLVDLDENVNTYLDFDIKNPHHPHDPITLRQLLSHTSSINDDRYSDEAVFDSIRVVGDWPGTVGDFLKSLLVPGGKNYASSSWHRYAPGKRFDYSNIGATTAAHVAECVAQKALKDGGNLGHILSGDGTMPTFSDLANKLFQNEWGIQDASYHLADLNKELDIAIPSTIRHGEAVDYCLWGYPDYPDGNFRASPTSYSYLLRTFMNFGIAPPSSSMSASNATDHSIAEQQCITLRKKCGGDEKSPCCAGLMCLPWNNEGLKCQHIHLQEHEQQPAQEQQPENGEHVVLKRKTVQMMRDPADGAGTAPGQEGNPQGLIWYYDDNLGKKLLGHNGGDDGISTDAFFNPDTNIGFVVFTNGDEDVTDKYADAMAEIETKLMETFDIEGGWSAVERTPSSVVLRRRTKQIHSRSRRRHPRSAQPPCGLPAA